MYPRSEVPSKSSGTVRVCPLSGRLVQTKKLQRFSKWRLGHCKNVSPILAFAAVTTQCMGANP